MWRRHAANCRGLGRNLKVSSFVRRSPSKNCLVQQRQSISGPLSLSERVLCECVSSRPWTWARGMCWEPGKTMGCHGNRRRLGKHTGGKTYCSVCGYKRRGCDRKLDRQHLFYQSFNRQNCRVYKCFPPIQDFHYLSITNQTAGNLESGHASDLLSQENEELVQQVEGKKEEYESAKKPQNITKVFVHPFPSCDRAQTHSLRVIQLQISKHPVRPTDP